MDRQETQAILAIIYTAWPEQTSQEELERITDIWEWAFTDDSYQAVEFGVKLWLKGGKPFRPTPSQIRQAIAEHMCRVVPEEEWMKVENAISTHYRGLDKPSEVLRDDQLVKIDPPVFHPITQRTIDACTEHFLRNGTKTREAFIFTMRNLMANEIDRVIYGSTPLEEAIEAGTRYNRQLSRSSLKERQAFLPIGEVQEGWMDEIRQVAGGSEQ